MSFHIYEPFYDFERLIDDSNRLLGAPAIEGAVQRRSGTDNKGGEGAIRSQKPRMDLHEDSEQNLVTASFELPGLKKEDVQIDVHDNRLTVSAESRQSSEHEESGYLVRERRFGKLSRTLQLPLGLKENQIKASFDNGVLTVNFPKASTEQAHKKIAIN